MAKELLLYGNIESESSALFINSMNEAIEEDISVRVNCNGGNPEYGWGMVAKFAEHPKNKLAKVDGKAYSFGAYFLCYATDSECLDVSEFLLHRAAYPKWLEDSEYFTEALKGNLERINTSLKKALENTIDIPALEAIMDKKPETKGKKFNDIFSMEDRLDVFLNAAEAKKIGLVKRINKITPVKKAEIETLMFEVTAKHSGFEIAAKEEVKTTTKKIMTLESLKAEHPELFKQVMALGASEEKERVGAWMVFVDIDPEAVSKGIEGGKNPTAKEMAELTRKSFNKEALATLEKESKGDVVTEEVKKVETEKEKVLAASEAKLDEILGLEKK